MRGFVPQLAPCPFCGSTEEPYIERASTCVYQVFCTSCGTRGPGAEKMLYATSALSGMRAAARLWNERKSVSANQKDGVGELNA